MTSFNSEKSDKWSCTKERSVPKKYCNKENKFKEICAQKTLQKDDVKCWRQKIMSQACLGVKLTNLKQVLYAQTFFLILSQLQLLTNCNSYFPLKVKGINGKNIFIHAQRLPLELIFLLQFVTQRSFWYRLPFIKGEFLPETVQSVKNKLQKATDNKFSQESEENEV